MSLYSYGFQKIKKENTYHEKNYFKSKEWNRQVKQQGIIRRGISGNNDDDGKCAHMLLVCTRAGQAA